MTRIYFKPQGCSVRNPRGRSSKLAERMKRSEQEGGKKSSGNWRKQLDPDAIEQIADGLEKMVLSWSCTSHEAEFPPSSAPQHPSNSTSPTDSNSLFCSSRSADQGAFLLPSKYRPMSTMVPALEDMMRGELIKTCRPSIANGESALAGQQSAEASFWYLAPAKSLPNCVMSGGEQNQVHDNNSILGGTFTPLEIKTLQEQTSNTQTGRQHKWPRIQSMDEDESGSDSDAAKETTCWRKESCLPAEKVSYHIKAAGSRNWSENIEINGGNQITELHGKKLTPISNLASYRPLIESKEDPVDTQKKKVEELQIALLECAMEYEVKIVEMKMQMLHIRSKQRQKDGSDNTSHSKSGLQMLETHDQLLSTSSCHQEKTDGQRVEYLRKQLCRLQREKLALSRELNDLKKRERQFDLQRRSLDDALGRVNALQRELGRREQEIVDCQLREKEVRAQLYEVQLALHKAQAAQIEPRKLLSLLPALREWLQTIKKVPCEPTFMEPREKSSTRTPPVDSIVCTVTKEIQALQKALSKLAAKK